MPRSHPLRLLSAPTATPPLAANKALATRENQGNLAPVKDGGRFFCEPLFSARSSGDSEADPSLRLPHKSLGPWSPYALQSR